MSSPAFQPPPAVQQRLAEAVLYTFVDSDYLDGRDPVEVARQLCDGGSDLIQLRAKGRPVEWVESIAGRLMEVTERAKVLLVINDFPEVALRVGAPLVHLGQEDFFDAGFNHVHDLPANIVPPASKSLPAVGLSTHAPAQAGRAVAAGAAYLGVGPVYATPTKPGATAVTLDYVRWAAAHVRVPWFAIGGIHLDNLPRVMEAGARRVCVVSAILKAGNTARACQSFRQILVSAGHPGGAVA